MIVGLEAVRRHAADATIGDRRVAADHFAHECRTSQRRLEDWARPVLNLGGHLWCAPFRRRNDSHSGEHQDYAAVQRCRFGRREVLVTFNVRGDTDRATGVPMTDNGWKSSISILSP